MSLLSKKEAAERLNISTTTLGRLAARGEIGFYRISATIKFDEADIQTYLARVRVSPTPQMIPVRAQIQVPPEIKRGRGRPPRRPAIPMYYPGMKVV